MSKLALLKGERTPLLAAGDGWPTEANTSKSDSSEWEDQEQAPVSTKALLSMFIPMTIGLFLVAADGSMVVSSYAAIGSDMKQLQRTSWISTGYLLTMTSFQPMYGRLSLIFGKKNTLLFAYTIFTIGSFLCGFARNMNQLVIARALAGIGGGGISIVPTIILTDVIPLKSRGTWQGILNLVYSVGSAVGGPLGGYLSEYMGWRWSFLFQVPVMVFAIIMVYLTLQVHEPGDAESESKTDWESPRARAPDFMTKLQRLDLLGAVTLILAVSTLLLGLQRLGEMCYNLGKAWLPLTLSLGLFATFWLVEFKVAKEPIAPKRIVMQPSLCAAYFANFFAVGASMSLFFHVALYMQAVLGKTATQAGVWLLPSVAGGAIGSLVGGLLIQATGGFYYETIFGYVALFVGCGAVALASGLITRSVVALAAGFAVAGYGNGHGITTSLIALIYTAGPEDQAIATSVSYLFRSLGSALSLSVGNAVVQTVLVRTLRNKISPDQNVMDLVRLVQESLDNLDKLDETTRNLVRQSYGVALKTEFILTCALALCAICFSTLIKRKAVL